MSANEKIFPAPDTLNNQPYGKFVLTNLAAKRAQEIKNGAHVLVRIDSDHPLSIALAEIAAGIVKPLMAEDIRAAELEGDTLHMDGLSLDDVGDLLLPGHEDDDDLDLDFDGDIDLDLSADEDDLSDDEKDDGNSAPAKSAKSSDISDLLGDDDDDSDEDDHVIKSETGDDTMTIDDFVAQEDSEDDEDEE